MAIGRRMPPWISDGFSEYAQRLRSGVRLELVEVDTPRRGQNPDLPRIVREEGARLLQAACPRCQCLHGPGAPGCGAPRGELLNRGAAELLALGHRGRHQEELVALVLAEYN